MFFPLCHFCLYLWRSLEYFIWRLFYSAMMYCLITWAASRISPHTCFHYVSRFICLAYNFWWWLVRSVMQAQPQEDVAPAVAVNNTHMPPMTANKQEHGDTNVARRELEKERLPANEEKKCAVQDSKPAPRSWPNKATAPAALEQRPSARVATADSDTTFVQDVTDAMQERKMTPQVQEQVKLCVQTALRKRKEVEDREQLPSESKLRKL
jgi:hypothetical protein